VKEKGRYVRKIDRKKLSGASVIALLTFITGAAFFTVGMYMTVYPDSGDAAVAAVFGWITLLLAIVGIVAEIYHYKVNERLFLFDKWGIALNSIMLIGIIGIYVWGIFS